MSFLPAQIGYYSSVVSGLKTSKLAQKDVVKENWANTLAIGAAIMDSGLGLEVDLGVKDMTGAAAKIGSAHTAIAGLGLAIDLLLTAREKHTPIDNPRFIANGHEGESPETKRYFKARKAKKMIGSVVSGVGSAVASVSAVNVGGIARHGRAVAN